MDSASLTQNCFDVRLPTVGSSGTVNVPVTCDLWVFNPGEESGLPIQYGVTESYQGSIPTKFIAFPFFDLPLDKTLVPETLFSTPTENDSVSDKELILPTEIGVDLGISSPRSDWAKAYGHRTTLKMMAIYLPWTVGPDPDVNPFYPATDEVKKCLLKYLQSFRFA